MHRSLNALLIVKPTEPFTDEDKLKLDQYVMNGGHIIWFIDKLHAELDSLMRSQVAIHRIRQEPWNWMTCFSNMVYASTRILCRI
jgi:ABC-type uncharacterized transport system involved in gliding motility auxiliary subunit